MNERIKELALQAKLRPALLLYYYRTIHGLTDTEQEELEQMEKFAQLIVQECLNQCYNRGMDDELYAGQLKAATYIEEYFGVEE